MKLADEIIDAAEKEYGNAPYEDRGTSIDTIIASVDEWKALIAAKLEPVRELLERIKSDVVCEGVPLKLEVDEYDKECSPKMALSDIGAKAVAALAMLSEEEK